MNRAAFIYLYFFVGPVMGLSWGREKRKRKKSLESANENCPRIDRMYSREQLSYKQKGMRPKMKHENAAWAEEYIVLLKRVY